MTDPLRNPLIYLEDLARSHDSDSERSGKSTRSEKEEEEEGTPALLSRPDNFNPFTPKT